MRIWCIKIGNVLHVVLQFKTGELDAAKNEIDSVPKFHLSQLKHLTSQYIVAVHSVQTE
jgi:hypothetical protein